MGQPSACGQMAEWVRPIMVSLNTSTSELTSLDKHQEVMKLFTFIPVSPGAGDDSHSGDLELLFALCWTFMSKNTFWSTCWSKWETKSLAPKNPRITVVKFPSKFKMHFTEFIENSDSILVSFCWVKGFYRGFLFFILWMIYEQSSQNLDRNKTGT